MTALLPLDPPAMPRRPRDLEGPFHRSVIAYLHLKLPGAVIHHSAAEFPMKGKQVANAIGKAKRNGMLVGFPDILVLWRGVFWTFEVKAPGGKPTAAQIALGTQIEAMGGKWAVVRSIDDAAACVDRWTAGVPGLREALR